MLRKGDVLRYRYDDNKIVTFDSYVLDDPNFFFTQEIPGMFNYIPNFITASEIRKHKLEKLNK